MMLSFTKAEHVARTEFELTGDPHAFLLMVSAADKDGRFFDCKRDFEEHPNVLDHESPIQNDLRELTLRCFLETREIDKAADLSEQDDRKLRRDAEHYAEKSIRTWPAGEIR